MRTLLHAAALSALLATPAVAMMSGNDKPSNPSPTPAAPSATLTPRQQAETWYADAYDEVAKANEVAKDNARSAEKRFKKALDRALRATELDTAYHEAWNLVGYCSRKTGKLDASLEAYARCLRIKPDYAAAREYLGEAHLEKGNLEKAREQLAALERLAAEGPAATLRAAIAAYEKAHPAPAASGSH